MQLLNLSARMIIMFIIATTLILITALMGVVTITSVQRVAQRGQEEIQKNPQRVEEVKADIAKATQSSRLVLIVTGLMGCVLSTMLGVLLTRIVCRPVALIRERLETLAEGGSPEPVPYPAQNPMQDDISRSISALNTLIEARNRMERED